MSQLKPGKQDKPINIEVISDYACPWCFVGKRRLESAIALRPELRIEVCWQPFQLNPDMPQAGRLRSDYYQKKFGKKRAEMLAANMKEIGTEVGIAFCNEPEAMAPNTLSAHVMMWWARENRRVDTNKLAEKLFHAHHVACENIGDHGVLLRIAQEIGWNASGLEEKLRTGVDEERVTRKIHESTARGISGVPFFIIDGRFGLSGAQPVDVLVEVLDRC